MEVEEEAQANGQFLRDNISPKSNIGMVTVLIVSHSWQIQDWSHRVSEEVEEVIVFRHSLRATESSESMEDQDQE